MFGDTTFQTAYHPFHISFYQKVIHPIYVLRSSVLLLERLLVLVRFAYLILNASDSQ